MATALRLENEPKRPTIRMIPTDRLVPTADNLRRKITNGSVESLAKSIAREGLLHPIVVRPHPVEEGKWEIRAGERRWRAARLAGLTTVPAVVRRLDDEAAMAVTITENLQRENLHPLEEGRSIRAALDQGQNPRQLAARLGKPLAFVLRRASLADLSPTWREAVFIPDSDVSRLSVAHLEVIARLPAETQESLAADDFATVFRRGFPSVDELKRIIDDGLRTLVSMPWTLDDEALEPVAGSCLNCPKRSGKQPVLFDCDTPPEGGVSPTDRCLDPACFDRKHAAFLTAREAELRRDHPDLRLVQIGSQHIGATTVQAVGDRTTRLYQLRVVKKSDPAGTPIMQIDGPMAGVLMHADLGDKPPARRGAAREGDTTSTDGTARVGGPMTLAERQDRLARRRQAFVVKKVEALLREFTLDSCRSVVEAMPTRTDAAASAFDPLALLLSFGTTTRSDRSHDEEAWERYTTRCGHTSTERATEALHEVVQIWSRRLAGTDLKSAPRQARDAGLITTILAIDIAAIEREAEREIPEPRSWQALREAEPHTDADQATPEGSEVGDESSSEDAAPPHDEPPKSATALPARRKRSRRSKRRR